MGLKKLLNNKKITQTNLAKKLHISQQLVSCWITGTCQPQLHMVSKLAEVLNVTTDEIIDCFKK